MADVAEQFARALEACVVRLEADGGDGSGVWIAPGVVLTCAHVVDDPDGDVTVWWSNRKLAGAVQVMRQTEAAEEVEDDDLWPYPDLALVVVRETVEHPCVWLAEPSPSLDSRLIAMGYTTAWSADPQLCATRGSCRGWHGPASGRLWRFVGDEFHEGMSGGPVLDLGTGAVTCLIKATRGDASASGLLTPVAGLRRVMDGSSWHVLWRGHDRFHFENRAWTRLRASAGGNRGVAELALTPDEEVDLLYDLGALNPVPPLEEMYRLVNRHGRRPVQPFVDIRDLAQELVEALPRPGDLHPILAFAVTAAGQASARLETNLLQWAHRVAGRRNEYEQLRHYLAQQPRSPVTAERSVVTTQVVPSSLGGERFLLTMWTWDSWEAIKVYATEGPALGIDDLRSHISMVLRRELRRLRGNALVEFMTNMDLFKEPFEELTPIKQFAQLGNAYPVVFRSLERAEEPEVHQRWQKRWQRLREGPMPLWLRCDDERDQESLDAYLSQREDAALVGLTRSPEAGRARQMLEVAIHAGVPAIVWTRDSCLEHDTGAPVRPCTGDLFRMAFDAYRSVASETPLIESVRLLRMAGQDAGSHPACRRAVLLWDDPYRIPEPDAPLAQPTPSR
jgi:hypothetical protein